MTHHHLHDTLTANGIGMGARTPRGDARLLADLERADPSPLPRCLLCNTPTTGCVTHAGHRFSGLCQDCKDAEDARALVNLQRDGRAHDAVARAMDLPSPRARDEEEDPEMYDEATGPWPEGGR